MTETAPSLSRSMGFDPKRDFLASMVVFLVAMPLCIGIASAVGVSPGKALITGIIGGMVVGVFGGCPLQVCGPAAGLFVIIADALLKQKENYLASSDKGSVDDAMLYALTALGVSVMIAGALQFIAGQLKLGQWFRAVSPAVIEGMLGGIGILILVNQFHAVFDHDAMWNGHKAHGGLQYIGAIPGAIQESFAGGLSNPKLQAGIVGSVCILIIALWQAYSPKKIRLIPGALIAVLVAVVIVLATGWDVRRLTVAANIMDDVTWPTATSLRLLMDGSVWLTGGMIAVVASAETLLCATAVDQMQTGPRTKYDQELCAHGIGNFLCGVLGALPMTGVIVRSSTNVQAGATSRLSTILHGTWLLIFVVLLPHVLEYIPKAALGAILVYTGYKLVKVKTLVELWKLDRGEAFIFVATMTIIVVEDLLLGVLAGLAMSAVKLLHRFSQLTPRLTVKAEANTALLELEGAATFIRLPVLASFLDQVPAGAELHVDFSQLTYIDHACLELMTSWAKRHNSSGGKLVIDWDSLHARFKSDSKTARTPKPDKLQKVLV